MNRNNVRKWMMARLYQNREAYDAFETGEANTARLVEEALVEFPDLATDDVYEDPDHWIWEVAIGAARSVGMAA